MASVGIFQRKKNNSEEQSGSDPNPGVPMTKYRRKKPQRKCAETKKWVCLSQGW